MPLVAVADIRFSNVDKKSYASEKPVRLCNYTDVFDKEYVRGDEDFMHATASEGEISRFAVKAGDVIITKDSETPDEIGVPAAVLEAPNDLLCGYHLALIRPRADQVDPVFLAKQLAHTRISRYYARLANGLTRYGLTNAVVENTPVWLPDLAEQHRAAAILRGIDRAIGKTEALIAKLKAIKQGLLHDLLTRGLDDNGELRDPEKHPEQFKDTPIGRMPLEWTLKKLGEVAEILDHLRVPVNSAERLRRGGNVPYYGANGIQGFIDEALFNEPLILLAEDGGFFDDYATRPIAYRISGPSWVNNHAHVLRPSRGVDFSFLFYSLEHRDIRWYIRGGTRSKLNQGELRDIDIAVPREEEQQTIGDILDSHDRRLKTEEAWVSKLKAIKKGLMQDLLTGRVRVPAGMIAALSTG